MSDTERGLTPMDLKEYYKALEKVLAYLQANPDAKTDEVKALSGEYWVKVKEYLKENKVVGFLADGTLWSVNRQSLERCLTDIRIKLGEYKQEKKKTLYRRLWEVSVLFLDALIAFYAGWLLRGCTPEYKAESGNPEPFEQSMIICDSISLSEASLPCLNAVSTPSLAKSLTDISESSASTRLMCSTLNSSMWMDAVQSSSSDLPLHSISFGKLYIIDIFIPQI